MTEDATRKVPEIPRIEDDPDATIEAPRIAPHAAPIFEVVIACPECDMRQTFRGTEPEIGDAAEVWQKGHRRTAHADEKGLTLKNGKDLRLPEVN